VVTDTRHRWLVHRDVARTVDLLLRGQLPRPQVRELDGEGRLQLSETPQSAAAQPSVGPDLARRPLPRPGPAPLAPVPLPDPQRRSQEASAAPASAPINDARPLLLCCAGVSRVLLEQAIRSRRLPVQPIEAVEEADAVLAVRQQLGQAPELRRRAQAAAVPILVIKADTLPQIQRGLERLLTRRDDDGPADEGAEPDVEADRASGGFGSGGAGGGAGGDDALAALEECRLAVEQLVLPQGRPVELLPRSEAVRQMQAELAARYQLSSAVFGSGRQQRLRIFPR